MKIKPALTARKTHLFPRLLFILLALQPALHDARAGDTIIIGDDGPDTTDPADYLDPLVSALIKDGTNTVTLTGNSTYTDGTTLNTGGLLFGSNTAIGTGTLTIAGASTIGSSNDSVVLTNNNAQAWNADFSINGSHYVDFGTGAVTMDATRTITVNGYSIPTVGGIISSSDPSAGLTIRTTTGGGYFQLSGDNTYTGTTTIGSNVFVMLGRYVGASATGSVAGDIVNNGVLAIEHNNAFTIANNISGTGELYKDASNTVTISGNNTYTGVTTVEHGTLIVGSATGLGNADLGLADGTLDLNGYNVTVKAIEDRNGNSGTITNNAASTPVTLTSNSNTDSIYSGTITDGTSEIALVKGGTGALALAGANTYSGGTTLNSGTLNINNSSAIGTGTLTINGGTIDNTSGSSVTLSTNNTQAWNGDFTFGGSNDLNLGSGAVTMSSTRTITMNGSATLNMGGVISGSAGLSTVAGDSFNGSTLRLTAANTYTGTTTIGANTSILLGGAAGAVTGNIVDNGTLIISRSDTFTFDNAISGTGSLLKVNSSIVTLSGNNSYSGGTSIQGGAVNMGSSSALGATTNYLSLDGGDLNLNGYNITVGRLSGSSGTITNNASATTSTLTTNTSGSTFNGNIQDGTGAIALVKGNTGTLTLTGNNTYSGGTTLNSGGLNLNSSSAIGTGTLTINGGALDNTSGSPIALSTNNAQVWNSDFAFGATNDLDLGTGAVSLTGSRTISLQGDAKLIVGGVISNGSGAGLTITGTGNSYMVLAGDNTYTGTTTVDHAILGLGNGGATGSIAGDVALANGGILTINRTGNVNLSQNISGHGLVSIDPGANVTLSGNNSYDTGTYVYGGTLNLNSATALGSGSLVLRGNVTLDSTSGASITLADNEQFWQTNHFTFGGTKDLNLGDGVVTMNGTTTITALGNSGTALTIGGEISSSDPTAGLIINGGGSVKLTGNSTYTGGTTITNSQFFLGDGGTSGSIVGDIVLDNGLLGFNRSNDYTVANKISGTGTVGYVGSGQATVSGANTYTGANVIAGNVILGQASALGDQTNSLAVGPIGTLDLNGYSPTVGSIDISAYSVTGGTITNNAASTTSTLTTSSSSNAIFDGVIADGTGTVALVKDGTGDLTLSGDNTYSGGTTISQGALIVGSATALGASTSNLSLHQGTLDLNGHSIAVGALGDYVDGTTSVITNGSATTAVLTTNSAADSTYSGTIKDGTGLTALAKGGTGALTLAGTNTYSGGTTLNAGTLNLMTSDSIGTGALTINGGTIGNLANSSLTLTHNNPENWNGDFTYDSAVGLFTGTGTVTLNGTRTVTVAGDGLLDVQGAIVGPTGAGLIKNGAGNLLLEGANTYSGTTTINAGILSVNGNGSLGAGEIIDNAGFSVNSNNSVAIANKISGTGSFYKGGTGTATLSGDNTFTGGTTLDRGTLKLGSDTALGASAGSLEFINGRGTLDLNGYNATVGSLYGADGDFITNSAASVTSTPATLTVNNSNSSSFGGTITDGVDPTALTAIVKSGTGSLTLSGTNTFSGGFTLNAGTLNIASNSALGSGTFTINGGTIDNPTGDFVLSANNPIALNGDFTFTGSNFHILSLGSGAVTLDATHTITFSTAGSRLAIEGVVSGATPTAGLTLSGSGNLFLNGASTYTGDTTISRGSGLYLGGSVAGNIVANGSLLLQRNDDFTLGNTISGTGAITKFGTGNVTISGNNSAFTGETRISGGTITAGNNNALGASSVRLSLSNSAVLDLNGHSITVGLLSDGTTQSSIINNAASTTSTLTVTSFDTMVYNGTISDGSGTALTALALTKGTLTLGGDNSYSSGTTLSGGTLNINNSGSDSTHSAIGTGRLTINGGTLGNTSGGAIFLPDNKQTWNGNFTYNGADQLFMGSGDVTMSGTTTITVTDNLLKVDGKITAPTGSSIIKNGNGSLFLGGTDNNFDGGLTINAGQVVLNAKGAAGTGAIVNNGTFAVNTSDTFTMANTISGTGSFFKDGSGTLTLTGDNSFTGSTVVNGGKIVLGSATAIGAGNQALLLSADGSVDFNGHSLTVSYLSSTDNASGALSTSGGPVTLSVNAANSSPTSFNADINGAISVVKSNFGTVALGGANSDFSGGTTFTGGKLDLNSNNAIGTGSLTLAAAKGFTLILGNSSGTDVALQTSNDQFWNSDFTYQSSHDLELGGATVAMTGTRTITISDTGALIIGSGISGDKKGTGLKTAGTGTLILDGNNTYTGTTTIAAGTTLQIGRHGSLPSTNKITDSGTLALDHGGTFGNTISGKGAVTLLGVFNNLTLTGKNSYSGGTTINGGTSALIVGSAKALGSTKGLLTVNAGQLDLNGFSITAGGLAGSSGVITNEGAVAATLTINSKDDTDFGGVIQGSASDVSLVKTGKGVLILSGENTFLGSTTIKSGTLQIGNGGASGAIANSSIVNSAILSVNRSDTYAHGGVISGKGSFEQNGTGNTTLTGANTYTGSTTVNAGTLTVGNATALGTGSKASVILNGGTLQTDGAIHQINVGGNLSLDSNATIALTLTLDAASEFVNIGGKVSLLDNGPFVFTLTPSGLTPGDHDFIVMTAAKGFGKLTGEDFAFTSSDQNLAGTFSIVGNNLIFTDGYGDHSAPADSGFGSFSGAGPQPVPEPSTWALLILGAAVVVFAKRRTAQRR